MYVYLLIYGNKTGDRESIKAVLNSIPEVLHWRFDMPNSFYIKSDNSASELCELFAKALNKNSKRFLIVEITDNKQGYLLKETWNFINDKLNK